MESSYLINRIFFRRFQVVEYIASGGMSVVYRVWDLERNVYLAMKVLHADLLDDPKALQRFEREARALQKLAHPHIVPFYGLYRTEEIIFLVEKYVDGLSLKELIRQRQAAPLPNSEILIYLKALCTALVYAHFNGVVHCDVKPGNVMIDRSGMIFLTDFGVARHAESTTTTIGSAGTPAYMAPEQIRGEPVTAETDVYALGIMLYEMLTGRRPFAGTEIGSESSGGTAAERVRYAHLSLAPADPRDYNPEIPEALAAIILRALDKDSRRRYPTTIELLDAVCDVLGTTSETIPDNVPPPELPAPISEVREKRSRPWLWLAIGGTIAAAIACGGIFLGMVPALVQIIISATPTSTYTLVPSSTLTSTTTFSSTIAPTSTQIPTLTATSNPIATHTDTLEPLETPSSGYLTFYVKNNANYSLHVYIDGEYLGLMDAGMIALVEDKITEWGDYTFRYCKDAGGKPKGCQTNEFNVDSPNDVISLR